jgi:catechol 2,3-dioxygenase-like lactoylglutathione lyase family enzyme
MNARVNQIALIVEDADASVAFYRDVFGVPRVGSTVFKGKVPAKVQALPDPCFAANWHMDDREYFQLEMFRYDTPKSRPYARRRRPWDVGYSRIAMEVNDPHAFRAACIARGLPAVTEMRTIAGKPCFTLADPNGILVEVGPAARAVPSHLGARFAGVALSVPSLDVALKSYRDAIGCPVLDATPPDKGALWGEQGARKRSVLLDGGTIWLEVTEYAEPVPRPWPAGYRICDHGIMNVAFGFRDADAIRAAYDRMARGGFRPNAELVSSAGQVIVGYLNDPQGFNVELLMVKPWLDGVMGFRRETRLDKVLKSIMMKLA